MKKSIPIKTLQLVIATIAILLFWCINTNLSFAAINFEPPVNYEIPKDPAEALVYADFDGDGDIDLALAHTPGDGSEDQGIFIHLNNGDGSYVLGSQVHYIDSPISTMTSVDLDNDGDIDLATANMGSEDVTIFLNDGNAVFTLDSSLELESDLRSLIGIATADFDLDNDIDIAMYVSNSAGGYNGPAVVLYMNDGAANFAQGTILYTYQAGYGLGPITAEDLNGDSFVDIAVIAGDLLTFFNNGDGTFTLQGDGLPSGDPITSITPLDVDGDEDLDLITYQQNGVFSILLNNGNGIYYPETALDISPTEGAYTTTDLDNDGDFDIAFVSYTELYIYLQNSLNDFILQETISNPYFTGGDRIISTDINNDDKTDIIVLIDSIPEDNKYIVFLQSPSENQQPVLSLIGNQTVNEGELLEFTLNATDPDGDELTFAATNLPTGSTFDPETGLFSWTPSFEEAGNYENIEFSVMDDGIPMELDVELITITVGNTNRAPEIENPGPQEIIETNELMFSITAADPDGDSVILSATDMPLNATFDGTTFTWTPSANQEGVYTVTFIASDDATPSESSNTGVVITVGDNPTPVEQTEHLIDEVITIELPQNVENSYLANLNKVEQFITQGNITPAINQINAFINKVNQDLQQGNLTQAEADALIDAAEALLEALTNN